VARSENQSQYGKQEKSATSVFISLFLLLADEVEAEEVKFFVIYGFVKGEVDGAQVFCAVLGEGGEGLLLLRGREVGML